MTRLSYGLAISILAFLSSTQAQTSDEAIPMYNIIAHCREMTSMANTHQGRALDYPNDSFNTCLALEKADYAWLTTHWRLLSLEAKAYCRQVVGDPNEDYGRLKTCATALTCAHGRNDLPFCANQTV